MRLGLRVVAAVARVIGEKLAKAKGPTAFILPLKGIEEWDRPGEDLHDPDGLAAFIDGCRAAIGPPTDLVECDAHINDPLFVETALEIFDGWVRSGVVKTS